MANFEVGSPEFVQSIKNSLGMSENSGKYDTTPNSVGAMGKYQFIPARLADLGYGDVTPQNFTPQLQEEVMSKHISDLLSYGTKKGYIKSDTDPATAAGLVWAGHLGGYGGMNAAAAGQEGASDNLGTSVGSYFKKGVDKFRQAAMQQQVPEVPSWTSNKGLVTTLSNAGDIPSPATSEGIFSKAHDAAYSGETYRLQQRQKEIEQSVIDSAGQQGVDLEKLIQEQLNKSAPSSIAPELYQQLTAGYKTEDRQIALDQVLRQLKETNPSLDLPAWSSSEMSKLVGKEVAQLQEEYARSNESATWTQWAEGLAGSMVGFMHDPYNLASMIAAAPFMASGMGVGAALSRTGAAVAAQVPVEVMKQQELGQVGLPSGFKEGLVNLAGVGVGALGFDMLLQGLGKAVGSAFSKGSQGLRSLARKFDHGTLGDEAASMQSRSASAIARAADDTADILQEAPRTDTVEGRLNFAEKMDLADRQMIQDKPVDVVPDSAPIYEKPIKQETQSLVDEVTKDFTPNEYKAMKADADEWVAMQQRLVSGTEDDAARVKAGESGIGSVRERVYSERLSRVEQVQKAMEAPEYKNNIESSFDSTMTKFAENYDYTILKTQEQITKLEARMARDVEALNNWDQVETNMDIPEYKRNNVARQHISQRVEDQKVQLENRKAELEKYQQLKERQGTQPAETVKTMLVEDHEGNIVSRPVQEVIDEVTTERKFLSELSDCIKRNGV